MVCGRRRGLIIKKQKICIVGLGYVGLPLAVAFAEKFQVIGFDIDLFRIQELKGGHDRTLEIDNDLLNSVKSNISYASDIQDTKDCNIYIITVPTPIDKSNRPDLTPLVESSKTIGTVLKQNDIVIYESTVYPGCTEEICVPLLEEVSGLIYNKDFYCGYSPERINPGDKVNTITKVKKITSGSTPKVSEEIDSLYNSIIDAGTFKATCIKVAEAAKVIENTQRDLNIALVNELSVIFARLDIDTSEVLQAAGSKWNFQPFWPGMVGGHCIGVDPYYLTYRAEQVGYNPQVILSGRRINDNMAKYVAKKVVQNMINNSIDISKSKVGVLGITFKENCPDIRNSKVVDLVNELKNWNINVIVSDPWADPLEVEQTYGISLGVIDKNNQVDSLIVAVGHNEFRDKTPSELRSLCNSEKPVLADVKSLYDRYKLYDQGFTVFRL